MGLAIASDAFKPEDYRHFSQRLTHCLDVLRALLADPDFGGDTRSWGAELELYLTDASGRALDCNQALLAQLNDPRFTPELNRFNLELNSSPVIASERPLSALQAEMEVALQTLRTQAQTVGATPVAIGILPTVTRADFGPEHMTPLPRYTALERALQQIGSGEFRIDINGTPPLQMRADDVTYEGANTSLQIHYRVRPQHFAALYNGLLLATPIVMALAGNSPTFLGHRLWHETRVPLFKHAIDCRARRQDWRQPARVSLGTGYLRASAYELFAESVAIHPPLLPVTSDIDYGQQWQAGIAPGLNELCMHQNTVWSWLRPVYDVADGGHLRIELRALPAGPTLTDMLANAAFYIGLGEAFAARLESVLPGLPFQYTKYNFYRAAQWGLEAELVWPTRDHRLETQTAATLARQLLPWAREGLQLAGLADSEITRYLGVIDERVGVGQTGASWQLAQLNRPDSAWPAPLTDLQAMLAGYCERQQGGEPVARWSSI